MNISANYLVKNRRTGLNLCLLVLSITTALLVLANCSGDKDQLASGDNDVPEVIDFNLHVRSILSESCFACHGPDGMTREAGLRLDTPEGAYSHLSTDENRFAIVPGNPMESDVYLRIISDDPDYKMPSPTSNLHLNDRQIEIIKRWIEQGAEYKEHWAFIPPEKTSLPEVSNSDWPINEIDHYVLNLIEERGFQPSNPASKEILLRRVTFDLTGLPPTLEELDNFLADDSPDAYERVVDRLLASDSYGERMASEWLDVARYADTHGYQDDGPNGMWPWREWVIHAFNDNMPFDQFTTWQLAGDLLPNATQEQKLATGFGRLHQQNQEGGIIGEEYRVEYVADRVRTTGIAFMGVTMQCAKCHDHKYDPVSEREYYQFSAFFDNINDTGQIPNSGVAGPTILLPDDESEQIINYLSTRIEKEEEKLLDLKKLKNDSFYNWLAGMNPTPLERPEENGLVAHIPLNELIADTTIQVVSDLDPDIVNARVRGKLDVTDGVNGNGIQFSHSNYISIGKPFAQFDRSDKFSFSFWVRPTEMRDELPLIVKTGMIFIGYRGYDISLFNNKVSMRLIHGWPYNSIQVITNNELEMNEWNHVAVTYDGSSRADGISIYINGDRNDLHIEHDDLFKSIAIPMDEPRYHFQDFLLGYRNSFEDLRYENMSLDDIKIFDRILSPAEAKILSHRDDEINRMLSLTPDQLTDYQKNVLFEHYLYGIDNDVLKQLESLTDLRDELNKVQSKQPEVMVMRERLNLRTSYIRERGMYDSLGDVVEPGVPVAVMPFNGEFPQNRLGLAQWILHPDNPLTSRVLVNRYWQMFFGIGIVDTPDDFGNQGSLPTHPELLDWLAVEFMDSGWDVKNLLKQIVMSNTYRQSSNITPEMRELDPSNRLLARGPRYRMSAEMIRDQALAVSGLLVHKIGGPSVFPYQPEGLWEETTSGRHLTTYVPGEGDDLYRKSLYTFWKRTVPPPGLTTFDAAMRTHPVVEREQTSTPLQALHTLNDPIYIESSRVLAERMIKEGGEEIDDQIIFAFRKATSRYPNEHELNLLINLYEMELETYSEHTDLAEELLRVGDTPADKALDSVEVAAKTIVASAIFNLDETLTKK